EDRAVCGIARLFLRCHEVAGLMGDESADKQDGTGNDGELEDQIWFVHCNDSWIRSGWRGESSTGRSKLSSRSLGDQGSLWIGKVTEAATFNGRQWQVGWRAGRGGREGLEALAVWPSW